MTDPESSGAPESPAGPEESVRGTIESLERRLADAEAELALLRGSTPVDRSTAHGDSGLADSEALVALFLLGGELFCVPVVRTREILRMLAVTPIPESPPGVLGVINLGGRLVPILDARQRVLGSSSEPGLKCHVMIVEADDLVFGFVVDEVVDVVSVEAESAQPVPGGFPHAAFVHGVVRIDTRIVPIIDLATLLSFDQRDFIRESAETVMAGEGTMAAGETNGD